ncbi:TPA: hypothetical protein ACUA6Z_004426 [Escherichia coli]|nr:hypothetical protein [Escherichia coli]HCN1083351.1 hypothetical protein [Escherichia coli]HCN3857527.1 hypothetical protein [Escherichia coli]
MIEMTKEELTQATKEYGKKHIAHRMANVLLALSEQKPSAFVMKDDLADPAIVSTPAYLDIEDAEQKTIGDIVALYADPFPVIGDTTALVDDTLNILALLEAGDWSEHCTKTELGSRLEREITQLIGDAQNDLSPEHLPCDVVLVPGMRIHEGVRTKTLLTALQRRAELSSRIKLMPSKIFDVVKFTPSQHTERDK